MKKSVALLLAFVVLSSFAYADSYDLNSFDIEPSQAIVVGTNDEVRFDLFNATHTVVFTKVTDVGFRITGYGYLNDEYKMTGFATKKFSSHLDVDRDGTYDIIVAFYDAEHDEETNETYNTVIFKLEEGTPTTGMATGNPEGDVGVVKEGSGRYLAPVGALVFILVLVVLARKFDKKDKKEEPAVIEE